VQLLFDNLFGKKQIDTKPIFSIRTELHPYSLKANKSDFVDLEVLLANHSPEELLTSLVVVVPKQLGFERSIIQHEREMRLGYVAAGEQKRLKVQLWASERSDRGEYPVRLFAISHYKDYGHVLNEARKQISIRVE